MLICMALTCGVRPVDVGYQAISAGLGEPGRIAAICLQDSLFRAGPDVPAERLPSYHSSVGSPDLLTPLLRHCNPPLLFTSLPSPPAWFPVHLCPFSFPSSSISFSLPSFFSPPLIPLYSFLSCLSSPLSLSLFLYPPPSPSTRSFLCFPF